METLRVSFMYIQNFSFPDDPAPFRMDQDQGNSLSMSGCCER